MNAFSRFLLWPALPAAAVALASIGIVSQLVKATAHLVGSPGPANLPSPSLLDRPQADPWPFLRQWCFECHGEGASKGGLTMDGPEPLSLRKWDEIRRHTVLHTMPPQEALQPPPPDRLDFESNLLAWQASHPIPPAAPPLRRLTRRAFANAMTDLVDHTPDLHLLPEDESAHGFDNNSALQPLPPTSLERWSSVIRSCLETALLPAAVPSSTRRFMPQEFTPGGGKFSPGGSTLELESAGWTQLPLDLPCAGTWRITLKAYAHQAGESPASLELEGQTPATIYSILRTAPDTLSWSVHLPAGSNILRFRLANPFRDPRQRDPHRRIRRLLLQEVECTGPLTGDATPSPRFLRQIGPVPPPAADWATRLSSARSSLESFAHKAWRRPPPQPELDRLTGLFVTLMTKGQRYDQAMVSTLEAVLLSPRFLFLTDPASVPPAERPWTVVSRLSDFLWSRPPDPPLLAAAARAWDRQTLRSESLRLLRDSRARAFAEDFAGQWLQFRNIPLSQPDPSLFPDIPPDLKNSLLRSTTDWFLYLVRENRPVLDLLDSPIRFQDARLSAWWDSPAPPSHLPFRTLSPRETDHHGLLGHPAVLLATSYPNRTSPVLRGKYILETLLGLEPPPAPPNVPALSPPPTTPEASSAPGHRSPSRHSSVRNSLEAHRSDRACASCHQAIDPLGFPLEAFDAIGRTDPRSPVPAPSVTFTGHTLTGPSSLHAWLRKVQGTRIVHHTANRLLTYALGRGLTPPETLLAHQLADSAGGPEARFQDLLLAIISSPAFSGESPRPIPAR